MKIGKFFFNMEATESKRTNQKLQKKGQSVVLLAAATKVHSFLQQFIPIFLLQTDDTGVAELQQGGVIYLLGVVFFKLDGRLPLAHAIWHLHVVVASMIHYHAVDKYLISPEE